LTILSGQNTSTITVQINAGFTNGVVTAKEVFSYNGITNNTIICERPQVSYTFSLCSPVSISPLVLLDGQVGASYTQIVTQMGLVGTVVWQISAGSLPSGLELISSTGEIVGTPTTLGTFNFTIKAISTSMGCNGIKNYTIKIPSACATIAPPFIATAYLCKPYTLSFTQNGMQGNVTWSINGDVPPGLAFANGILSGTPTSGYGSPYSFTVQATNGTCTITKNYKLTVVCPAPGLIREVVGSGGSGGGKDTIEIK
jgi:large repetitive protein